MICVWLSGGFSYFLSIFFCLFFLLLCFGFVWIFRLGGWVCVFVFSFRVLSSFWLFFIGVVFCCVVSLGFGFFGL
jgi:hypothetical protein